MINKYKLVKVAGTMRTLSLFLILSLTFLSYSSYTSAANPIQQSKTTSSPSKVATDIINPGLDPMITLSSNSATLFAGANSTGEVNVTSNITWLTSQDLASQSWLTVTPTTGTGNGTLTFTALANKGAARTATITIWATGVAPQTILVTQSQEQPAVNFSSSVSGSLSIYLQFNTNTTFYIDWGDGNQIPLTTSTMGNTYSTATYVAGNTVKVFGSGITNLNAGLKNLTAIDVSLCTDLTYLYLEHNNLTSLDVTKNTKLTYLDFAYNNISSLNTSNNPQLNFLSTAFNNLSSIDVTNNTLLSTLNCISNKLSLLDVHNNTALTTLYCYSNKLSALDVSKNTLLTLLYCNNNNFYYTSLPQPKSVYTTYSNAPQARIAATVVSNKVDISSQLKVNDINNAQQTTVYKWYTKTGTALNVGTDYTESNGVFSFLKTPSDSVYCTLANAAFPDFTGGNILRTVNLKVSVILPTVTTQLPSSVGTITAVGNGNIVDLGIPNPTSYGVCWNTTGTPTTSDNKVDLGAASATGAFTANMTGLAPGTTYYVRAFATNVLGTSYGLVFSFTTVGTLPSVSTLSVSNIGLTSATGNGNITSLGAPNPTQYGVVWGTSTGPTTALSTKTTQGAIATTGAFTSNITGLTPNTLYYVRAYVTNIMGTVYGPEVISFTTLTPTITTPSTVTLSGFATTVGTASASQTFIIGGSVVNNLVVTAPAGYEVRESGTGTFGATVSFAPVSGVVPNKTIEVRIAATAPLGTVSGNVVCSSTGAVSQNVAVTGVVSPIQLTATNPTLTLSKVYNGNTVATVIPGTLAGVLVADQANVTLVATATYDNANVGTGKTITVTYNLTGTAAIKYIAPVNYTASGDITKAPVTVTAVTDTKTYNGTTSSAGIPVVGALATGDIVNLAPIQVFDNQFVGTTHVLTASGLTIKNASNVDETGNYTITYIPSPATGVINKLALTVTAVTDTKTYNGTTSSAALPIVGALATGDVVNAAPIQVFDNSTVGTTHVLTASGLTIKNGSSVDVTNNYTITYAPSPATGVISKLTVIVTAVTDTKTYNGTTASVGIPTVVGLAAGDAINVSPVQVFDNSNVGTTHVLTASGLTIKNGSSVDVTSDYTINYVSSPATGVINKFSLIVTAVTNTKTYNGTTASVGIPTVGALVAGDVINVSPVQVFDNPNVGTTHVLTASGLTIKNGSNADVTGNYSITYIGSPATGVINKLAVTVTAVTDTKTYNGTTASAGIPIVGALAAGDVVNAAPIQVFDNQFAGTTHVLTASGLTIKNAVNVDETGNYAITYIASPATGVINKLAVTVTAVTDTKTYNGTTASAGVPVVGALASGDVVNAAPVQVFDNATVGTTHILTASGLTIKNGSNVDVTGNYTITYVASPATGVINKYTVTVAAVTDTKTYNGTVSSNASPTVGSLMAGDVVNVAPVQVFDNSNVGTTHVLTASGLTIKNGGGTDVTGDYTINYVSSPATGVINKFSLIVTAVTNTKTYNGTTASAGIPTVGALVAGDVVNAAPIEVFDNPNVGTTHVLTPSGLTLKNGSNADVTGNYSITYTGSPATGVINKLAVTVTAVTDTKTYNGTTASAGIPVIGALAVGDVVNVTPVQVFDNPNAGTTHVLNASGLTVKNGSNADVTGNYAITYTASPATGVIGAKALTASAPTLTTTKVYDGNTTAAVTPGTLSGVVASDVANVTLTASAAYDNVNVNTGKTITVTYGLTGTAAGNYLAPSIYVINTGIITGKPLTASNPTITTSKVYDGSTTAVVTPGTLSGVDPADLGKVVLTATATYDNANTGTGKTITVTYGLTGTSSGIYSIPANYTVATGIITVKPLTASNPVITTVKVYDGTNSATVVVGTLTGVITADLANVVLSGTATYNNANVGTGKTITCTYSLTGSAAGNYGVPSSYAVLTGQITGRTLTVSNPTITTNKVYDGTTTVTVTPGVLSGLEPGDVGNVTITATASYDNVNVGTGKTITVTYSLSGPAAGNYTAPSNFTVSTGVITGMPTTATNPTITLTKIYDGSISAVVTPGTLSGIAPLDIPNVTLTAIASYDNANSGKNKTITVTYGLTGSAAAIYAAPANFTVNTGVVTAKPLTATPSVIIISKPYDGTVSASVTPGNLSGVVAADLANVILNATAVYDNIIVGTGKTITVTYGLSGSAAGNYTAPSGYSVSNGIITGKLLTVATLKITTSKVYDGTTSAIYSVGTLSGVTKADSANVVLTGVATYDNANAGTNKNIIVTFSISGSASGNYIVPSNYTITNGEITPKLLTITNPTVVLDKMYDKSTNAVVTSVGTLQGLLAMDVNNVTVSGKADYDNMNVGINKTITVVYTLSGSAKNNYSAPANFIIQNAIISDNVMLSPVVAASAGCAGNSIDLDYTVLTGTPTQYKLVFDSKSTSAGIQNVSYTNLATAFSTGTISFPLPSGITDGTYTGTIQMRNELGVESVVYNFQFVVNLSSNYIVAKFDDVVLCDNSSNRFVGYQWYKNGVLIEGATKQFYNDLDGLIGSYSLQVTTTDGHTLFTCPKVLDVPLVKKVSIYPSPVRTNQSCTVKLTGMLDVELEGADLTVYSIQGVCVYHTTKVEKLNTIILPPVEGIYLGYVTTSKGEKFPFKVTVTE